MEQPASPDGLQQWVAFLRDKPLPVHARTSALLLKLLEKESTALNHLQRVIASDPVFSMHAVSLANQLNRNPDTDVSTVELAVSTLGMDRIAKLADELPRIKINHNSVPHKQFFRAIADSYHAASQAAWLCRYPNPAVVNETRIAAMIYGIGQWAMWRYAPQQMSDIKVRIYEKNADRLLAEYDVLGCTIREISLQLARHWQLSRLAVQALQNDTTPNAKLLDLVHQYASNGVLEEEHLRQVKQLLNAQYYPVKLANWLSLATPYRWQHRESQRIIGLIADFTQKPIDEITAKLQQVCAAASRQYHIDGIMSPAAQMLLLPSDLVLSYRLESAGVPETVAGASSPRQNAATVAKKEQRPPSETEAAEATFLDETIYRDIVEQLSAETPSFEDSQQVMLAVLKGLRLGLGLHRVCLFQVKDYEIRPLKQTGFAKDSPLPRFTQDLHVPSLFQKLANKPLAVWVANHNRAEIWPELPVRFKEITHQHSFLLISLFVSNEPMFYLYGDRGNDVKEVSKFDFTLFKQLAITANRCLNQHFANPS